jgi:hypothetical protein
VIADREHRYQLPDANGKRLSRSAMGLDARDNDGHDNPPH